MSVWAIVVAGGSGSRFGAPKQFADLAGRRLVDWSMQTASQVCDGVVLVLPASAPEIEAGAAVAGGATRSESVRNGLQIVPVEAEIVVVHDAARPLASAALFAAVIAAVESGADGAVPGLSVVDTVKRVKDGQVIETLDRLELVAVQTPQAFKASTFRRAHAAGGDATDDAALVEAIGGTVVVVPGETANTKITEMSDLDRAHSLMGERT